MDEAISHYQELAHLAPVDWGLVKQLADLLERAGQREGAARQFARWADYLFVEGFHSKASALYKKVLKLEPSDEHALWQLGDVSVQLKLRADARVAYQRVAEIRLRRGDAAGAAAARERLAGVDATPLMQHSMQASAPALMAIPAPATALPIVPPPAQLPSVRPAEVSISEAAGLPDLVERPECPRRRVPGRASAPKRVRWPRTSRCRPARTRYAARHAGWRRRRGAARRPRGPADLVE